MFEIRISNFEFCIFQKTKDSSLIVRIRNLSGAAISDQPWLVLPLGATSAFLGGLHFLSWQGDPCSRYKLDVRKGRRQPSVTALNIGSSSTSTSSSSEGPVVLNRKQSNRSDGVANVIAAASLAYALWKTWNKD